MFFRRSQRENYEAFNNDITRHYDRLLAVPLAPRFHPTIKSSGAGSLRVARSFAFTVTMSRSGIVPYYFEQRG